MDTSSSKTNESERPSIGEAGNGAERINYNRFKIV